MLVAGAMLAGCAKNDSSTSGVRNPPVLATQAGPTVSAFPVELVTVKQEAWVQRVVADAELISLMSPQISAEVAGTVERVLVLPGQTVKKGQLLAALSTGDLALSTLEAQAQSAQLVTQLAEKERVLARNGSLLAQGFISQAALETVQADVAALKQQVRAAQARTELVQRNLAKARIVAPYDAVVSALHVAPGAYVRAGDMLLTLWSDAASSVRIRIPQQYAGRVAPKQPVLLSWNGQDIATEVAHVRPNIDAASRSFEAHAHVPPALRNLTGVSLSATVALSHDAVVSVPAQAVQLSGPDAFVYVTTDNTHARKRMVKTGRQHEGRIEIVEGIHPGDAIVANGAAFIRDGQPILVKDNGTSQPGTLRFTTQNAAPNLHVVLQ